jgi:glucose/arabinose dehydrogenase
VPAVTKPAAGANPSGSPPAIALRRIASGFSSPLDIVEPPDGSGRLFVVEQGGRIRIIEAGKVVATPFLDVSARIASGGERGLLGLAFHPAYACNGRFFVNYTDTNGDTVVAEHGVSTTNPDRANPAPVGTLLHIAQPFANHNGGDLVFGPDGFLYVGMGDGGSAGDPKGNGQRLDTFLAKLLRIDVDHPQSGKRYGIPGGNCAGCAAGALPEIYSYGLRNPWRFSFDRATDDLWIGDVGQGRYEEIDHVALSDASGANFGWNRLEGRHCYPSGSGCDRTGVTLPAAEYDHSSGDCSITGGFVYRGSRVNGLAGWYLFSDYCSGVIRAIPASAKADDPAAPTVLLESRRSIVSFGEGADGELYVADIGSGEVLQIVAG